MSKLSNHPLFKELQERKNINDKLNVLAEEVQKAAKLQRPWVVFGYRSGKAMGILLTLLRNSNIKSDQVSPELVEIYGECSGNLAYIDQNGVLNRGSKQDPEKLRLVMDFFLKSLDIQVEDSYLADITQENWDSLYASSLERAMENTKGKNTGFVKPETSKSSDQDEEEEEEKKPQLKVALEKAPWDK